MMTEEESSTQSVPQTGQESKAKKDLTAEPQKPAEEQEDKTSALEKKFRAVEKDVVDKEIKRLEALREAVDKKVDEYQELVTKAEEQGKALQTIEMSEEEKVTKATKDMFKGTAIEDILE